MKKSFGVALACFNGIKYISAQLESICRQAVQPDLISISDDCSTDGTSEFLREFKRRSNIPVAITSNARRLGVIENFLNAFRQCDTDYIAYCDQDDVWHDEKVAICKDILSTTGAALVIHKSTVVNEDLVPLGRAVPFNVREGLYQFPLYPDYLWGFGHQMVASREVVRVMIAIKEEDLLDVPQTDVGFGFDFAFPLAAGMVGDIFFLDQELMKFRRHRGSVSPAGKFGVAGGESRVADSRADRIQRNLAILESLLLRIPRTSIPVKHKGMYVDHLRSLRDRYGLRKAVYGSAAQRERVSAFASLVRTGAYGSMLKNQLPAWYAAVDCGRALFGR